MLRQPADTNVNSFNAVDALRAARGDNTREAWCQTAVWKYTYVCRFCLCVKRYLMVNNIHIAAKVAKVNARFNGCFCEKIIMLVRCGADGNIGPSHCFDDIVKVAGVKFF